MDWFGFQQIKTAINYIDIGLRFAETLIYRRWGAKRQQTFQQTAAGVNKLSSKIDPWIKNYLRITYH